MNSEAPTPLTPADFVPTSRDAAIKAMAPRYLTGAPCPNGHNGERYTVNGYCVECQRQIVRESRARIRQQRPGS